MSRDSITQTSSTCSYRCFGAFHATVVLHTRSRTISCFSSHRAHPSLAHGVKNRLSKFQRNQKLDVRKCGMKHSIAWVGLQQPRPACFLIVQPVSFRHCNFESVHFSENLIQPIHVVCGHIVQRHWNFCSSCLHIIERYVYYILFLMTILRAVDSWSKTFYPYGISAFQLLTSIFLKRFGVPPRSCQLWFSCSSFRK